MASGPYVDSHPWCGLFFYFLHKMRYDAGMKISPYSLGEWFAGASVIIAIISPFILIPLNWYAPLQSVRFIALGVAVACAGVAGLFFSRRLFMVRHSAVTLAILFTLWMVTRSIISPDARMWFGSWTRFDGLWMFIIATFFLIMWSVYFHKNERAVSWSAGIFCVVAIGTTLASRYLPATPWFSAFTEPRWSGFTGNALYLSGTLLLVPWAASRARELWRNNYGTFISVGALVVTLALLYKSFTRSALIAGGVGILVWFINVRLNQIIKGVLALALTGTIIGLLMWIPPRPVSVRLILARVAVEEFMRSPIAGYGWGSHVKQIAAHARDIAPIVYGEQVIDTSHSFVLDLALGGGLIALLLLVAGTWFVWRQSNPIERATLAALVVWASLSFVNPWSVAGYVFFVATIVARTPLKQQQKNEIIFSSLGVMVCFLLIGGGIFTSVRVARDARALTQGEIYFDWSPVQLDRLIQTALRGTANETNLTAVLRRADEFKLSGVDAHKLSSVATSAAIIFPAHRTAWLQSALAYNDYALQLTPDRPDTLVQRADIYREQGNKDAALATLRNFIARNPQLPQAHFFYAVMLSILGHNAEAVSAVQQAFILRPADYWEVEQRTWAVELLANAAVVTSSPR